MPRTSTEIKTKKTASKPVNTEQGGEIEAFPKSKRAVEIEDPETLLGMEEKNDDESLSLDEEEEELSADEAGIDDEELNPFGDKWEE